LTFDSVFFTQTGVGQKTLKPISTAAPRRQPFPKALLTKTMSSNNSLTPLLDEKPTQDAIRSGHTLELSKSSVDENPITVEPTLDLVSDNVTPQDLTGMKWVTTLRGLQPRWTTKPNKTAVKTTIQTALELTEPCEITSLGQGGFNKLYTIKSVEDEVVARVSLPIDPKWKTLSEVATLTWVLENTGLPVPRVLAYCAERSNPIGFEWIAMEKIPGRPWEDVWQDLDLPARQDVVRQIALFCADSFARQMRGIGNLFPEASAVPSPSIETPREDDNKTTPAIHVQRMVSLDFLTKVPSSGYSRGPFHSSRDWMLARLKAAELDCRARLHHAQQLEARENDNSNAPIAAAIGMLHLPHTSETEVVDNLDCMEGVLPREEGDTDGSKNHKHDCLKEADAEGKQGEGTDEGGEDDEDDEDTGVEEDEGDDEDDEEDPEDLEHALQIIAKLKGNLDQFFPTAGPEPESSMLHHADMTGRNILIAETGALSGVVDWENVSVVPLWVACDYPDFLLSEGLDIQPVKGDFVDKRTGEVNSNYWRHKTRYELTQLRHFFLDEMRMLQPGWVHIFESSKRQRDFDFAVVNCDSEMDMPDIYDWLEDVESGREGVKSLCM
jgi:aminoglycoside phosphotransferase (APT) family kinase protein